MSDRLVSPQVSEEEQAIEGSLRPRRLAEYIGQEKIKDNLTILLEAARRRHEAVDHILLYGPPGLGKTTLCNIIATEMGVGLRTTSGPAIEHAGDLASILTSLQPGEVLFIDEIHRALEVDEIGLDVTDRNLLHTIIEKFNGGPVGLDTLAASTSEDSETIEDVYEPYLLQLGFIARTPRGRIVTRLAYQHLGMNAPEGGNGQGLWVM